MKIRSPWFCFAFLKCKAQKRDKNTEFICLGRSNFFFNVWEELDVTNREKSQEITRQKKVN